jgi:hypothetical protein
MKLYKAVVESTIDPAKLGRVQIRVLGVHSHIKNDIPTADLPWANICYPPTMASNSGVGQWSVPCQGSWVWCFPEDDNDLQRWVVFGSIAGIPQEVANTSIGFNDPDGNYPLSDRIPEPDINRLAANRDVDKTIIPIKVEEVVKNIKISSLVIRGTDIDSFVKPEDLGQIYIEPQEPYATEYPYNKVLETEPKDYIAGHIIELDDSPGNERIHLWHKTGTFTSIHSNGQKVVKIVGDNYEMNMMNKFEFVNDSRFTTIWGDDRKIVKKARQVEVYGRDALHVKGNKVQYISGDFGLWIGSELVDDPDDPEWVLKSKKLDGSGEREVEATEPQYTEIGGNFNQLVERGVHRITGANEHVTVKGSYYCEVTGSRTDTKNLVGAAGFYTLEPHGEFLVKAWKTARMKGCKMILDKGIVNGFSICPFLIAPHMHKSFTTKSSF